MPVKKTTIDSETIAALKRIAAKLQTPEATPTATPPAVRPLAPADAIPVNLPEELRNELEKSETPESP